MMLSWRISHVFGRNFQSSHLVKRDVFRCYSIHKQHFHIGINSVIFNDLQKVQSVECSHFHTFRANSNHLPKVSSFSHQIFRTQVRKAEERKEIVQSKEKPFSELTTSEKVTRAGKDATYSVIVIAGIAVTGALFFAIGRELMSGQSPSGIYSRAFKLVRNNDDVQVYLGDSIKGYGETNRRGRRRHVNHVEFMKDGFKHMRMKFYVEGEKKGTVHLEAKQNESGKYEFRYLFVEVEDYPKRTIVIEDNR